MKPLDWPYYLSAKQTPLPCQTIELAAVSKTKAGLLENIWVACGSNRGS
jgi:hypothetical protein